MQCLVTTQGGAGYELPEPYAWRISQSLGLPCGAVSLSFDCEDKHGAILQQAETVSVLRDVDVLFRGVVDSFHLSADASGRWVGLSGRSLGARLQDNMAAPGAYAVASWNDLIRAYVTPLGLKTAAVSLPSVRDFKVESQQSVWRVLSDFVTLAGGGVPVVTPEGILTVMKPGQNAQPVLMLTENTPVTTRRFTYDRYDVIAQVTVRNRDTQASYVLKNSAYSGPLGRRQVLTGVGAEGVAAMENEAKQRMAESMRRLVVGQVTLPGGFTAAAGDVVDVSCGAECFHGRYVVWLSETSCDDGGLSTRLELLPVEAF